MLFPETAGTWPLSWIHVPSLQLKGQEAGKGVITYVSGSQALLWEKLCTGEKGPCVHQDWLTTLFAFTGAHVREAEGGVLEGTGTNPTPTPQLLPMTSSLLPLMAFNFTPAKSNTLRAHTLCLIVLGIPLKSLLSTRPSHSKGTMNVCLYDLPSFRKIKATCQARLADCVRQGVESFR